MPDPYPSSPSPYPPSRHIQARVVVAPTRGSKARIVWASFRSNWQADEYAKELREKNPTWTIQVRYGTRA